MNITLELSFVGKSFKIEKKKKKELNNIDRILFWIFYLYYRLYRLHCSNIIGLPAQEEKCFVNNKNVLFLYSNYKIIEHEMNKLVIHTHAIFIIRNAMFSLSNIDGNDDVIVILYG